VREHHNPKGSTVFVNKLKRQIAKLAAVLGTFTLVFVLLIGSPAGASVCYSTSPVQTLRGPVPGFVSPSTSLSSFGKVTVKVQSASVKVTTTVSGLAHKTSYNVSYVQLINIDPNTGQVLLGSGPVINTFTTDAAGNATVVGYGFMTTNPVQVFVARVDDTGLTATAATQFFGLKSH
jgi:hypothetical protein